MTNSTKAVFQNMVSDNSNSLVTIRMYRCHNHTTDSSPILRALALASIVRGRITSVSLTRQAYNKRDRRPMRHRGATISCSYQRLLDVESHAELSPPAHETHTGFASAHNSATSISTYTTAPFPYYSVVPLSCFSYARLMLLLQEQQEQPRKLTFTSRRALRSDGLCNNGNPESE